MGKKIGFAVGAVGVGLLFGAVFLLTFGRMSSSPTNKRPHRTHTIEVDMDLPAGTELIEMEVEIEYYRPSVVRDFVLSIDEAGDRAFGTTLVAYRRAAEMIPSAQLRSERGQDLLQEKAWAIIEYFNMFAHEPVRIVRVNVKEMTFDRTPEGLESSRMLFLEE